MKTSLFLATVCLAGLASVATAQTQYNDFLGTITTFRTPLPLAADADGRLFYGTFIGNQSALLVIDDPVAAIGQPTEAGTTITVFNQFPNLRGLQSLVVNGAGSVFASGDTGSGTAGNIWKFDKTGVEPSVSFVEDLTFNLNVTTNAPARRSGLAIINDAGAGLLASSEFSKVNFFDFTGATIGTPLTGATQYIREIQFNGTDNVIYPLRNGGNSMKMITDFWENVNTSTGAADLVTSGLLDSGAANTAFGAAAQNGYYNAATNQLITCDGPVVISGEPQQPTVRVWDIKDNGTSLELAYQLSETDPGVKFPGVTDAVVLNDKLYISSSNGNAIYVFGPTPAAVKSWRGYESAK